MKKIDLGTSRFIELFNKYDIDKSQKFDAYILAFKLNEKLVSNYRVIGSINGMEPVIIQKKPGKEVIMVHDSVKKKLITVAEDRKHFIEIISEINKIWKDYPGEMFLPRNEEIMSGYKEFVKYITGKKNIDYGFWIDFAFKELDIRYEL